MAWRKICHIRGGHRLFIKAEPRDIPDRDIQKGDVVDREVYIADQSGNVPSTTDDGELIVDQSRLARMFPLEVRDPKFAEKYSQLLKGRVKVDTVAHSLPLRDEDGKRCSTLVHLGQLIRIVHALNAHNEEHCFDMASPVEDGKDIRPLITPVLVIGGMRFVPSPSAYPDLEGAQS